MAKKPFLLVLLLIVQGIFLVPLTLLVAFCGWECITRYRLPYNEAGRYFDPERSLVYHEQALLAYGGLLVLFLMLEVLLLIGCCSNLRKYHAPDRRCVDGFSFENMLHNSQ